MGGFLWLFAGGVLGYHLAKERYEPVDPSQPRPNSWGHSWGCNRRREINNPVDVANSSRSPVAEDPAHDWKLFQQWKAQQEKAPFFSDSMKQGALENADRALDSVLSQVTSLKEKLAQHRSTIEKNPSPPASDSGFRVV